MVEILKHFRPKYFPKFSEIPLFDQKFNARNKNLESLHDILVNIAILK